MIRAHATLVTLRQQDPRKRQNVLRHVTTHQTSCPGSTSARTSPQTRGPGTCPCCTPPAIRRPSRSLGAVICTAAFVLLDKQPSNADFREADPPWAPVEVLCDFRAQAGRPLLLLGLHRWGLCCCDCRRGRPERAAAGCTLLPEQTQLRRLLPAQARLKGAGSAARRVGACLHAALRCWGERRRHGCPDTNQRLAVQLKHDSQPADMVAVPCDYLRRAVRCVPLGRLTATMQL